MTYVQHTPSSPSKDDRIKCPKGTQLVGYYHTHLDGASFSQNDLSVLFALDHRFYMSQDGVHVKKAIPMRSRDRSVLELYYKNVSGEGLPVAPKVIDLY